MTPNNNREADMFTVYSSDADQKLTRRYDIQALLQAGKLAEPSLFPLIVNPSNSPPALVQAHTYYPLGWAQVQHYWPQDPYTARQTELVLLYAAKGLTRNFRWIVASPFAQEQPSQGVTLYWSFTALGRVTPMQQNTTYLLVDEALREAAKKWVEEWPSASEIIP